MSGHEVLEFGALIGGVVENPQVGVLDKPLLDKFAKALEGEALLPKVLGPDAEKIRVVGSGVDVVPPDAKEVFDAEARWRTNPALGDGYTRLIPLLVGRISLKIKEKVARVWRGNLREHGVRENLPLGSRPGVVECRPLHFCLSTQSLESGRPHPADRGTQRFRGAFCELLHRGDSGEPQFAALGGAELVNLEEVVVIENRLVAGTTPGFATRWIKVASPLHGVGVIRALLNEVDDQLAEVLVFRHQVVDGVHTCLPIAQDQANLGGGGDSCFVELIGVGR